MGVEFGWQDLFVVGIGFDVAGAWLLARGLLADDPELALRTASFWGGNPYATLSQIKDRIRGMAGVWSLILGFGVQAGGYALTVGLDNVSKGNVLGVAVTGLVPVVVVIAATELAVPRLQRRQAIRVARYDVNDRQMQPLPSAQVLVGFARALGYVRSPGVTTEEYVRGAFGVTEVRDLPEAQD